MSMKLYIIVGHWYNVRESGFRYTFIHHKKKNICFTLVSYCLKSILPCLNKCFHWLVCNRLCENNIVIVNYELDICRWSSPCTGMIQYSSSFSTPSVHSSCSFCVAAGLWVGWGEVVGWWVAGYPRYLSCVNGNKHAKPAIPFGKPKLSLWECLIWKKIYIIIEKSKETVYMRMQVWRETVRLQTSKY